jgi:hypothetical protein
VQRLRNQELKQAGIKRKQVRRPKDKPDGSGCSAFISANLDSRFGKELIKLLKEYKDCFTWDYLEMPGLDRSIVEHRLPIKPGFRPYKQPPRKIYKDEVLADVKRKLKD